MKLLLSLLLLPALASAQTTVSPAVYTNGVAESTTSYLPQIDNRVIVRLRRPENPLHPMATGMANNLPVGGTTGRDPSRVLARFPGISFTGWDPPDPHMAAGPTDLVGVVNSSLAFFSKTNGAVTFQQDFSTFFASLNPGTFIFDPKVIYDRIAKRFVVIVLEEDDASQTSKILVAVSDDSNPAGTWFKYRLETKATVNGQSCWADYPGLGYNKDAYVLSFNMFSFTSGFQGIQFLKILKSSVLSGGAAATNSVINIDGDSFTAQVAEMYDPANTKIYAINTSSSAAVKLWTLGNLTGAPTVGSQSITVPAFTFPSGTARSASGHTLDSLDGRMFNCMFRGGKLVATHTITQAPTDDRCRVRWYEFNVPGTGAATLAQSGDVKESSANIVDFHMGSICKSPAGEIALIFTRSSDATSVVADIMRTSRKSTDAAGTMATPTLVQSSLGSSYGSAGAPNRWGDYSAVTMDPIAENTFWAVHMNGDSGSWKTEIFSFLISNSVISLSTTSGTIVSGGAVPTLTVTLATNATAATNVALTSSNPAQLSVPATVTVAAGTASKTFTPTLGPVVHANTAVVITASLLGTSRTVTEIVTPKVATITFSPTSAVGGGTAPTGTITMNGGAVTANTVINLSSSNPAVAIVPASVTVTSGSATANFAVSLPAGVDSNTTVTVTAPNNGGTGTLTVVPATLATFVLNFSSIAAGSPVTGTVTLNGKAGPSGRNVTVTSDNTVAFPTNPVKVAAGTNLKSFIISTRDTTATVSATLTATLTGVINRSLSVFKGPALSDFTIIPGTVKGGVSSTGTPKIASAAPVGGVLIQFVESSPSVIMPLSALIAQGATTTPVGIATAPVAVTTIVPITARNNGITKTKSITINP